MNSLTALALLSMFAHIAPPAPGQRRLFTQHDAMALEHARAKRARKEAIRAARFAAAI